MIGQQIVDATADVTQLCYIYHSLCALRLVYSNNHHEQYYFAREGEEELDCVNLCLSS
jgi:hypothetical protein